MFEINFLLRYYCIKVDNLILERHNIYEEIKEIKK